MRFIKNEKMQENSGFISLHLSMFRSFHAWADIVAQCCLLCGRLPPTVTWSSAASRHAQRLIRIWWQRGPTVTSVRTCRSSVLISLTGALRPVMRAGKSVPAAVAINVPACACVHAYCGIEKSGFWSLKTWNQVPLQCESIAILNLVDVIRTSYECYMI